MPEHQMFRRCSGDRWANQLQVLGDQDGLRSFQVLFNRDLIPVQSSPEKGSGNTDQNCSSQRLYRRSHPRDCGIGRDIVGITVVIAVVLTAAFIKVLKLNTV